MPLNEERKDECMGMLEQINRFFQDFPSICELINHSEVKNLIIQILCCFHLNTNLYNHNYNVLFK